MSGESKDLRAAHARALALIERAGHEVAESRFDESYFGGGWYVSFRARSVTYRLVWDPRDSLLSLEREQGASVVEVARRRDTTEHSVRALLASVEPQEPRG